MSYHIDIEQLRKRGGHARYLRTYSELDSECRDFLDGSPTTGEKIQFLIIVGNPGTGKSQRFKLREDIAYVNNAASVVGLYSRVYFAKADSSPDKGHEDDEAIVLDDIDSMLATPGAMPFFKSLGQKGEKKISWEKQNTVLKNQGIPNQYKTQSRVCLIFNELPKVKDKNLQAVFDRARIVFFDPTAKELHDYVGSWWAEAYPKHQDVYRFLGENLPFVFAPSVRLYEHILEEKTLGHDWRNFGIQYLRGQDTALTAIAEMVQEPFWDDANQEERAAEFKTTYRAGNRHVQNQIH